MHRRCAVKQCCVHQVRLRRCSTPSPTHRSLDRRPPPLPCSRLSRCRVVNACRQRSARHRLLHHKRQFAASVCCNNIILIINMIITRTALVDTHQPCLNRHLVTPTRLPRRQPPQCQQSLRAPPPTTVKNALLAN